MKKSLLIVGLLLSIAFVGCQNKAEQQAREQKIQDSFASLMAAKDSEMENLFKELSEIDSCLTVITDTYTSVSKVANKSGEISNNAKAGIKDKIATINQLLSENKTKVAKVNSKLSKSDKQYKELQKFANQLQERIKENESQIQSLTAELQKKNIQIEELNKNINDLTANNKKKDAQIMKIEDEKNTAYFVIDTKKELIKKGLIDRKGGFIGLGKSSTLANNFDYTNLTKIDIRNLQEIPLTGKKIKIITTHQTSSYSLEGDVKAPTSIRITNPDLFWKANKCLVIQVD